MYFSGCDPSERVACQIQCAQPWNTCDLLQEMLIAFSPNSKENRFTPLHCRTTWTLSCKSSHGNFSSQKKQKTKNKTIPSDLVTSKELPVCSTRLADYRSGPLGGAGRRRPSPPRRSPVAGHRNELFFLDQELRGSEPLMLLCVCLRKWTQQEFHHIRTSLCFFLWLLRKCALHRCTQRAISRHLLLGDINDLQGGQIHSDDLGDE